MMSERNFARVIQQKSGLNTQVFIERCRFERATQLPADVAMPVKGVAAGSVFADEARMRRLFQKMLGITPMLYRERFATAGVNEPAT